MNVIHYKQFMQNQFSLNTFSIFVKSQCIVLPREFTFSTISSVIKYSALSRKSIILCHCTILIALILVCVGIWKSPFGKLENITEILFSIISFFLFNSFFYIIYYTDCNFIPYVSNMRYKIEANEEFKVQMT